MIQIVGYIVLEWDAEWQTWEQVGDSFSETREQAQDYLDRWAKLDSEVSDRPHEYVIAEVSITGTKHDPD